MNSNANSTNFNHPVTKPIIIIIFLACDHIGVLKIQRPFHELIKLCHGFPSRKYLLDSFTNLTHNYSILHIQKHLVYSNIYLSKLN